MTQVTVNMRVTVMISPNTKFAFTRLTILFDVSIYGCSNVKLSFWKLGSESREAQSKSQNSMLVIFIKIGRAHV